ncbi:FtsX-like permease family protein [Erysipelotrichaceae bacterium OttesenSCG-928-M19]|nr:FtsX-like permease family protein [Erysipelotrichaceae bacterium OttesenSCG-928-M19]
MKNTLNRALKYLSYKKTKSFLLIVLFFVISAILLLSATLNSTIDNYYSQIDNKNGIAVSISPKMNFNRNQGESQAEGSKPNDMRSLFTNLTSEQLEAIAALDYVTDVKQSTSVSVTSSSLEEISYTSSSSDDSNEQRADMPQMREDMSGLRIMGSSHLNLETDFSNETISLSSGTMPSADTEIVISEALASQNDLKVGSSFKVSNSDDSSLTKTYKVVGIYAYNSQIDEMAMQQVPENTMYTLYSSVATLISEDSGSRITTQFFIESVDDLTQFKTDYFSITDTSSDDYEVSLDDSVYQNTIKPLMQLAEIVQIAKWVILVITSAILAIISYLMIKERNYEIGVLYSLSENKRNISLQFVFENGILLTIGFLIAWLINMLLGSQIIQALMNMELLNNVKQGAQTMGGPQGMMGNPGASDLSSIEAYLSSSGLISSYVIILVVVLIITMATIAKTLVKRPKEIIGD